MRKSEKPHGVHIQIDESKRLISIAHVQLGMYATDITTPD